RAARLRDLLSSLRSMQNRQYVDGRAADLDVLACATQSTHACVLLLSFRDGRNLGTRAFFPKTNGEDSADEVLAAFVSQYYAEHVPPREILLDRAIPETEVIEAALSASAEHRVTLKWNVRGERAGYVELASRNAQLTLIGELSSQSAQHARSEALREMLGLAEPVKRVECFDISHTMGEATVASCVVFDASGPVRGQYRRYNIAGIEPGDDYAAMRQAIERRFRRAVEEAGVLPDLLLIDGGA
ncbi:excinuclease ABC subunit C, partial [Xanthomonas sp. Kuri4-2]